MNEHTIMPPLAGWLDGLPLAPRQRFERNRGMRIDFLLGSPALQRRVTGAFVDRDERAGRGASDHAPVVVTLVR